MSDLHPFEMTLELNKLKNEMQRYSNLMLEASVQLEAIKSENAALKESLTKLIGTFEEALEKGLVNNSDHPDYNNDYLCYDNNADYEEAKKLIS